MIRCRFLSCPPGDYCLMVTKDPDDSDPEWVQLQVYSPDGVRIGDGTNMGSLNNPSESANDGMLSVGAAYSNVPALVQSFSGKGPAPEPYPPDRIALDFVGGVFEGEVGTSFSSPRVAGLVALVIDALGGRSDYDTPSEVGAVFAGRAYLSSLFSRHFVGSWLLGVARFGSTQRPEA